MRIRQLDNTHTFRKGISWPVMDLVSEGSCNDEDADYYVDQ